MKRSRGWKALVEDWPWYREAGSFPLPAYSEYMPPPRVGRRPYGETDPFLLSDEDPFGWHIKEIQEEYECKPGLRDVANHIIDQLTHLARGEPAPKLTGRAERNVENNPFWPPELANARNLEHERFVLLLPLALSRTQDDLGRIRWTLFGASEQGPEKAFWQSFYSAPGDERPASDFASFIQDLLHDAYGETKSERPLKLGFRILPSLRNDAFPYWSATLPSWTREYILTDENSLHGVRYLLTFRPFAQLSPAIREAYLAGHLSLLPYPGSLLFWGVGPYLDLSRRMPFAIQVPLQRLVDRHGGPASFRVPQSGWMDERKADEKKAKLQEELLLNNFKRTSRWDRVKRNEDEVESSERIGKVTRVLFSTELEDIGLYDKPEARNVQIWNEEGRVLLDGPNATPEEIKAAVLEIMRGDPFRYRFQYPPMQVGPYAVYWQRPLVAYLDRKEGKAQAMENAPLGYMTAYDARQPDLEHPIELWPRLLRREPYLDALLMFDDPHEHFKHQTPLNALALFDSHALLGSRPLARSFARQILRRPKDITIEQWLEYVAPRMRNKKEGEEMRRALEGVMQKEDTPLPPAITFDRTATREFEVDFWNEIATQSSGEYQTKDNADVVHDQQTEDKEKGERRDLDKLGNYLIRRHRQTIADAGMEGRALVAEFPFSWQTDFEFKAFGGWTKSLRGEKAERDILIVIPGRNRGEAVVLADHYDAAYKEDEYDRSRGGSGARIAAPGADDNASATATLLLAAPVFLQLFKEGKLERDVWLLHLTGEEFPSDCLGARYFSMALVEGSLRVEAEGKTHDLSKTRVMGVYVMDMIAHNRDNDRDVFQIAPGAGAGALRLAWHAHLANEIWNQLAPEWNKGPERKGKKEGERSKNGRVPEIARLPILDGQVRTTVDPSSSLYNTDGQIFSDVGIPVVLFMENYDINRSGYHDSKDTMENIDLDYGAALARICIEAAARAACAESV